MDNDARQMERRRQFGSAVAQARRSRGISQERLALMAGIDRSYMGRIERGEQSVSLDKIWEIADVLQISPADLFQYEPHDARHLDIADTTPQ